MTPFNCTKCGLCCKKVPDRILEANNLPKAKGGGCGHLKEDKTCAIYETRPIMCRVDEGYDHYFFNQMSKKEWYELNERACKKLQDEDEAETKLKSSLETEGTKDE